MTNNKGGAFGGMASEDAFGGHAEGWSVLDNMSAANPTDNMTPEQIADFEERKLNEYNLNLAIHRTFSSPDGQLVYEFFRELATEGARFDIVNETDPDMAAAKGFFREGQAALYFEFKRRMNSAMTASPPGMATE